MIVTAFAAGIKEQTEQTTGQEDERVDKIYP